MIEGTWYAYFQKVTDPIFNEKGLTRREKRFKAMYGDFFDKHLSSDAGKLLSLGAGFGSTEVSLARRGYRVIGIDNDVKLLKLLRTNAQKYAMDRLEARFGDLYKDFHKEFVGRGIQACVSFGLLEHFERTYLDELIRKQFMISPLMICMMPINTPETLKTFKAEERPEGNIDENGIYRNFWSARYWKKEILKNYQVIDEHFCSSHSKTIGRIDMVVFAVREKH